MTQERKQILIQAPVLSRFREDWSLEDWSWSWDRLTEKGQHEDSVVANSKLIGVTEIISGREFIILDSHK